MNIAIAGITGRMGRAIVEAALNDEAAVELTGLCRPESLSAAQALSFAPSITLTDCLDDIAGADVLIDFTRPDYALELGAFAAENGLALVSGTTGFTEEEWQRFIAFADQIPMFWASNMSIGVALLMQLVERAAAALPAEYDIEIFEMHHRNKVDAPSGTAISLGKAAARGRGVTLNQCAVLSREGQLLSRRKGDIGFSAARGGGVIGDHTVIFAGDADRIELTHRAQQRSIYAQGALAAARWLLQQAPGLYGMRELIGE